MLSRRVFLGCDRSYNRIIVNDNYKTHSTIFPIIDRVVFTQNRHSIKKSQEIYTISEQDI